MAKVSKTRKNAAQEEQIGDIFQSLGQMTFDGGPEQVEKVEEPAKKGTEVDVTALMTQIGALQARQEQLEATNMALMAPVRTTVAPQEPQKFTTEDLPDPVVEPEKYAEEINKRINASFQSQQNFNAAQNNEANTRKNQLDALWDDFVIAYPAIAEQTEKAEFAIGQVAKKAKTRGIDMDRYMFNNSSKFMQDVEKEFVRVFGELEDGEDDEPVVRRRGKQLAAEEDEGRTAGIFGGIESGNRAVQQKPGPGDMIKDIQDLQRKSGFF